MAAPAAAVPRTTPPPAPPPRAPAGTGPPAAPAAGGPAAPPPAPAGRPAPAARSPRPSRLARTTGGQNRVGSIVQGGAGVLLGVIVWGLVVMPFLRGGPAEVRKVIAAKFLNKAPGGKWLP